MEGSWPCLESQVPCISLEHGYKHLQKGCGKSPTVVVFSFHSLFYSANYNNNSTPPTSTPKKKKKTLFKIWEDCLEMSGSIFLSNCHARHFEFTTWTHIAGCRGHTRSDRGKVNSFAKRSSLVIKFQAKSPVYYGFSFTSCLNMHEYILHEKTQCLHLRCHTQLPSERENEYLVKRMLAKARWWFFFFLQA